MIAESDIQALREKTPDVLRYYGVKNPSGTFYAPWKDGQSNTVYSPESQLITNWSSDERINVFGLVQKMEGIEKFTDQVKRVAEIVGTRIDENAVSKNPVYSRPQTPQFDTPKPAGWSSQPMLKYAILMQRCLESDVAMSYLHGRGFCNMTVFENCLGYVSNKEAFKDDDGSVLFSKYEPNKPEGYLIIPFSTDESFARVNYVMLRAIPGKTKPENKELRPKRYKSTLYREHMLRQGLEVLYVVEGLLDCLAFEQMTGKPVMALGGVSLHKRFTDVLFHTLPDYRPKKIVLALDSDEHGKNAAQKIADKLKLMRIPHTILDWPDGCKDACDVLESRVVNHG